MARRATNNDRLLGQIDKKLSQVLVLLSRNRPGIGENGFNGKGPLTMEELLAMPDHLRKTVMALNKIGRATSETISSNTKRARALESGYLNQLVMMGIVRKERTGRKVYFYIPRRKLRKH